MRSRKLIPSLAALLPALAVSSAVLGASRTASALPLITLSGSARVLYGSSTSDVVPSPYGAGLGLRLGVSLPASLYLGGSLDYFFGHTESGPLLDSSSSLLQLMGRAGYDLGLGPVLLRPQLGFGLSQIKVEVGDGDLGSVSKSYFVLAPGAEFAFSLGLLTLSAEVSYNKVFTDDADGVVLGVGVGFSL